MFTFLRCTCKPAGECLHLRTGVSASNTRARKYFGTFSPCLPDEQWISHQSLHREYSVLILYENCGIVMGSEMRIHGNIPKRILKNDPRTFSGSPNIHQQHRRVLIPAPRAGFPPISASPAVARLQSSALSRRVYCRIPLLWSRNACLSPRTAELGTPRQSLDSCTDLSNCMFALNSAPLHPSVCISLSTPPTVHSNGGSSSTVTTTAIFTVANRERGLQAFSFSCPHALSSYAVH